MTSVQISEIKPSAAADKKKPARIITGQRRQPLLRRPLPPAEDPQIMKKLRVAEDEIKESSSHLLTSALGHFTRDDSHRQRFSAEVSKSAAVSTLLQNHLGWISNIPQSAQLILVLGEKNFVPIIKKSNAKHGGGAV